MTPIAAGHQRFEMLPERRNLQPVMWESMRFESNLLHRLLEINYLAAFEDVTRGDMWVGLMDETVHEHDRWFFMIESREFARALNWEGTDYRTIFGCENHYANNYGFMSAIQGLDSYLIEVVGAYNRAAGSADPKLVPQIRRRSLALIHIYSLGYFMPEDMAQLVHARWTDETHDFLCHGVQMDEFEGMPRDLVLRAHGLRLIADIERQEAVYAARCAALDVQKIS